jgi:multiple antibiotic resistance protein
MEINIKELFTVTFTLFAIIDIIGSIPILISLKKKMGGIREARATIISGALMILFLFTGEPFLNLLGLDVRSFAVGGSIVIFILGLEMVLGLEFFKSEKDIRAATCGAYCLSSNCRLGNADYYHIFKSQLYTTNSTCCYIN